ncbi:hypothetical protein [Actinophytocola sp.]|uniref:hypothetical protein n=1 Tax=Actinophytocola sp. TaxID=1872138 RepID=UPI00389AD6B7
MINTWSTSRHLTVDLETTVSTGVIREQMSAGASAPTSLSAAENDTRSARNPRAKSGQRRFPLLSPKKNVVGNLSTVALLDALRATSAGVPPLAALSRALGAGDEEAVALHLINTVLDQSRQIDQLKDQLKGQLASLAPDTARPDHAVSDVQLVPTKPGSEQLAVVGKSSRPPGAHRQPATRDSGPTSVAPGPVRRGQHDFEPGATVRPLPTQRAIAPADASPVVPVTAATGTDTGDPTTTTHVLPLSAVVSSAKEAETETAEEPAPVSRWTRVRVWIRYQVLFHVLLWLVTLGVCFYKLIAPLFGLPDV